MERGCTGGLLVKMANVIRDPFTGMFRLARPGEVDPCAVDSPVTIEVNECENMIYINGTGLDMSIFKSCPRLPSGFGSPTGKPSAGYLPFYVDISGSEPHALYAYVGGSWLKTGG